MNRNIIVKIVLVRDQPNPQKTLGLSFDLILAGGLPSDYKMFLQGKNKGGSSYLFQNVDVENLVSDG